MMGASRTTTNHTNKLTIEPCQYTRKTTDQIKRDVDGRTDWRVIRLTKWLIAAAFVSDTDVFSRALADRDLIQAGSSKCSVVQQHKALTVFSFI